MGTRAERNRTWRVGTRGKCERPCACEAGIRARVGVLAVARIQIRDTLARPKVKPRGALEVALQVQSRGQERNWGPQRTDKAWQPSGPRSPAEVDPRAQIGRDRNAETRWNAWRLLVIPEWATCLIPQAFPLAPARREIVIYFINEYYEARPCGNPTVF